MLFEYCSYELNNVKLRYFPPGRVAQSVVRLTDEPGIPGSISGPTTNFRLRGSDIDRLNA